jgi:hypothetical protein
MESSLSAKIGENLPYPAQCSLEGNSLNRLQRTGNGDLKFTATSLL